ncbi:hypothetical protein VIBNISOn1_1890027 [Vibrio nigripulchritudo SOn1]|uniref:Uncharacterized protein n=1 Tax=Vibrio nigripulchritudo SOn1 TaxID=1238450 RepID=A0AAV2VQ10_9VIBR|nr:hypothetical protein VIBNISOn1_1890027 [Vibrio nigripulchritudo SOn1]
MSIDNTLKHRPYTLIQIKPSTANIIYIVFLEVIHINIIWRRAQFKEESIQN